MKKGNFLTILMAILTYLVFVIALAGCTDVTYNIDNTTTAPTIPEVDQFQAVNDAFVAYLGLGTGPVIAATDLFDLLNDGDTSNDPTIVSVRGTADYEIGHIPGAINIPWKTIADPANLAKIPMGKNVVVYCYTGHTGGVATTVLNSLGYSAQNLKFGMISWTKDPAVRVKTPFTEGVDSNDFPTETTANTPPPIQQLPEIDFTTSQDNFEIIRAAAEAYVAGDKAPATTAQALFDLLNDGDDTNDPVILSVRSEEDYNIGHIPGAVNIPWRDIAVINELKILPYDKEIIVYCYTGHTGALATTALNMMGYNAKNLKWGMMSWTMDPTVRVKSPYTEESAMDYAFNTGPNP